MWENGKIYLNNYDYSLEDIFELVYNKAKEMNLLAK